ncbi:hypothetical protein AAMO2058_000239200 [Amorphochlora amoebiformis]
MDQGEFPGDDEIYIGYEDETLCIATKSPIFFFFAGSMFSSGKLLLPVPGSRSEGAGWALSEVKFQSNEPQALKEQLSHYCKTCRKTLSTLNRNVRWNIYRHFNGKKLTCKNLEEKWKNEIRRLREESESGAYIDPTSTLQSAEQDSKGSKYLDEVTNSYRSDSSNQALGELLWYLYLITSM